MAFFFAETDGRLYTQIGVNSGKMQAVVCVLCLLSIIAHSIMRVFVCSAHNGNIYSNVVVTDTGIVDIILYNNTNIFEGIKTRHSKHELLHFFAGFSALLLYRYSCIYFQSQI